MSNAYLIVICDKETNAILDVTICRRLSGSSLAA